MTGINVELSSVLINISSFVYDKGELLCLSISQLPFISERSTCQATRASRSPQGYYLPGLNASLALLP